MLEEWRPEVGKFPLLAFKSGVLITKSNGCAAKKDNDNIIIALVVPEVYHRRYAHPTITVDKGMVRYHHNYIARTREEFVTIVKDQYPEFFEYLLFHPEWL